MNKAVLVLALFASAEGANLRRNVLEMTLATEELPTQTAAAPPPAAAPAAPAASVVGGGGAAGAAAAASFAGGSTRGLVLN